MSFTRKPKASSDSRYRYDFGPVAITIFFGSLVSHPSNVFLLRRCVYGIFFQPPRPTTRVPLVRGKYFTVDRLRTRHTNYYSRRSASEHNVLETVGCPRALSCPLTGNENQRFLSEKKKKRAYKLLTFVTQVQWHTRWNDSVLFTSKSVYSSVYIHTCTYLRSIHSAANEYILSPCYSILKNEKIKINLRILYPGRVFSFISVRYANAPIVENHPRVTLRFAENETTLGYTPSVYLYIW